MSATLSSFYLLLPSKSRAALIHLGLSAAAVGAVAALTLGRWYPSGLAEIQGVWHVLGLLIIVDLILGPMLTFIVFAPGKRSLRFDLAVIAAIQLAALVYGTWTITTQRPAYLAFLYDRFYVLTDRDLLNPPPPAIAELTPWKGGPRPVFVRLSFGAQQEIAGAATSFDTPAMALLPEAYAPFADHIEFISQHAESSTDASAGKAAMLRYPVVGRSTTGTAYVDQSGQLLDIVAGNH